MTLNQETILITGGSSGIGLEMAKQLTEAGNTVLIVARNLEKLQTVQNQLKNCHIYQADVSDSQSIDHLYHQVTQDFPDLNIIINNAGIMKPLQFLEAQYDGISREVDINLSGPIMMVQRFLPHLKNKKSAAIVNVSSGLAFINFDSAPIYSASKAGLHAYTKALRTQLKATGIEVYELAPPKTSAPLFNRAGGHASNNKMPTMDVPDVVKAMITAIRKERYEILPGLSKMLKLMGRLTL